jgi:hypothetical protein
MRSLAGEWSRNRRRLDPMAELRLTWVLALVVFVVLLVLAVVLSLVASPHLFA